VILQSDFCPSINYLALNTIKSIGKIPFKQLTTNLNPNGNVVLTPKTRGSADRGPSRNEEEEAMGGEEALRVMNPNTTTLVWSGRPAGRVTASDGGDDRTPPGRRPLSWTVPRSPTAGTFPTQREQGRAASTVPTLQANLHQERPLLDADGGRRQRARPPRAGRGAAEAVRILPC